MLSSDWRRHPQAREEARQVLASLGLRMIGCTPRLSPFIAQRPTEILQWKRDFCKRSAAEPLTNWIAIDDRALLEERHGQYLRGHFLQTHPLRGLTEAAVEEGVRLLSQEPAASEAGTGTEDLDSAVGSSVGGSRGLSAGARTRGTAPANLAGRGAGTGGDQLGGTSRASSAAAGTRSSLPGGVPTFGTAGKRGGGVGPASMHASTLPTLPPGGASASLQSRRRSAEVSSALSTPGHAELAATTGPRHRRPPALRA